MSRAAKHHPHVLAALMLSALLASANACGGGPRPESSPAPAEPAPAPVAAPAAPAAPAVPPEPELEPTADQLPLADDFDEQVEGEITAANYRSQLDALEREILADSDRK
jgi:hypothetical protein